MYCSAIPLKYHALCRCFCTLTAAWAATNWRRLIACGKHNGIPVYGELSAIASPSTYYAAGADAAAVAAADARASAAAGRDWAAADFNGSAVAAGAFAV